MKLSHVGVVALGVLAFAMHAAAEPLRITHAEPLRLQSSAAASQTLSTTQQRLTFDAFGRRFDLELEPNVRLLAEISPLQMQQLDHVQLLRGRIRGNPESWVRLTLIDGQYVGAIWDGAELYAIDAQTNLRSSLDHPVGTLGGTLIYRLSDSYGGVNGGACGVDPQGQSGIGASMRGYGSLVQELRQSAALTGTSELVVAMIVDHEFMDRYGHRPTEEMLARMNIVDGIYDEQVGVNIVAAEFTTFSAETDPFTTTNAHALLEQLGTYRNATPEVRGRGLAHLITGKDLDGNTLGVAYIGALCTVAGVGLSQDLGTAAETALVIAHELGHNFGANHDGEVGSACSSTPQTFLMAPNINGSSTFSACSRNSMQEHIAGAACVTPARVRDVAVSAPASEVTGIPSSVFDYTADVSSIGEETAYNVLVSASFDWAVQIHTVSLPGAACQVSGRVVNCQLQQLAPGEVRRLTVQASIQAIGTYSSTVTATSSVDRDPTNNSVSVPIEIRPVFDASISFTPETISVLSGEAFEVTASITAQSVGVLDDAQARVIPYGFDVLAAESALGACSESFGSYLCELGTLAPGQTAHVTLRLSSIPNPWQALSSNVSVSVLTAGQPNQPLRTEVLTVQVTPRIDLAIDPLPYQVTAALNQPTEVPLAIRSAGAEAIPDARISIVGGEGVTLDLVGTGIECTSSGNGRTCSLGPMQPGDVLDVTLRLQGDRVQNTYIFIEAADSIGDEVHSNSDVRFLFEVRPEADVIVPRSSWPSFARDGVEATLNLYFNSFGISEVHDVRAVVTLPEGFTMVSANNGLGPCAIEGRVATCLVPTLLAQQTSSMWMTFIAPEPGTFEGSFEVFAAEDADPTNNAAAILFEITPNVDAHLIVPGDRYGFVDEPMEWVFSVANGRYAMPDGLLAFELSPEIEILSFEPSRGSCVNLDQRIDCEIGTLEANEVFTVTLGVAVRASTDVSVGAWFSSPADLDAGNNGALLSFEIDGPGDIAFSSVPGAVSATIGERVSVQFDVTALAEVVDSFVELDFDPTIVSELQVSGGYSCESTADRVRCRLGTLYTGWTHRVEVSFVPLAVGEVNIHVRVGGRNDRNADNDEGVLRLAAVAPPPPPPTSPSPPAARPNTGGGGGGGGAMSPIQLLALLALIAALGGYRRKRKG